MNGPNELPKTFYLKRSEDESGVSGTGVVATGVLFPSGKAVLEWLTFHSSIGVYQNIEDVTKIHGHNGKTVVVFTESDEKGKKRKRNSRKVSNKI